MSFIDIIAILITFAAIFSYLNERYIGLPRTIGLMALSLVFSLGLMTLGKMGYLSLAEMAGDMLAKLDFYNTLMHGMLGFLLFAGALHVNFNDLLDEKSVIFMLATVGVIVSTVLVGGLAWGLLFLLGMQVPLLSVFSSGRLFRPPIPLRCSAS